jgi:cytochrome P450
VANDVLRYWISKRLVRTTADDLRTLSLHVMSRAGFGKSFKFQGHDQQDVSVSNEADINYKDSLKIILENCVLIFALGRKFLAKSWLPQKLRRVHAACLSFQRHLTQVYEEEKQSLAEGGLQNRNFMNSLVRASQEEATNSTLGGLTESEIYGNMFTFNFAGHDTTAHTFTFALYFLAANPATQDWISDEIRHVMGDSEPDAWSYSDYPRLKRCLAVLYETLRLYAPVPTSKFVDAQAPQALTVGDKTLILPPKTMIVPSYASLQTDPKYWGEDSLEWRPSRFIASSSSSQATSSTTADRIDAEEFITPARGTFLAWSGGARDCVGRKFSQVESVATIASLFRDWRVSPVLGPGETPEAARARVLHQIEFDSAPVLLLQMLHPEQCPLVWSRR